MRRRDLSNEEVNNVVKLRRAGSTWVKIQTETGIERRTAKRAYDKWEHSQSPGVLKEARKDVAAKAFLEHMESMITLAGSLVSYLSVPDSLADMEENTEQFFSWLFDQDLLGREVEVFGRSENGIEVSTRKEVQDAKSYRCEKQLLFEAFKAHTRGEEELRWDALDKWGKARDTCAKIVPKLRSETSKMVNNFFKQKRQANLLGDINGAGGQEDIIERIVEDVLRAIWKDIVEHKLGQEGPWFETVSREGGNIHAVYPKPRRKPLLELDGDTNQLVEEVNTICNSTVNNLCKGDTVHKLHHEVRDMEKATGELREMLNPVKLRPMILRTQCNLCPA